MASDIKRLYYVAGIDRPKYAEQWKDHKYWLLSVALVGSKRTGVKPWIEPYLKTHKILFDPGVFSKGFSITLDEYIAFVKRYAVPYGHEYLQLDTIGNAEETERNLEAMRAAGLDPIPVLQTGGDPELLKEPRVAIGGLLLMGKARRCEYLKQLFAEPGLGSIHLLGVTDAELVQYTTADTMDSTSWIPRRGPKRARDWSNDYGERFIPYVSTDFQIQLF